MPFLTAPHPSLPDLPLSLLLPVLLLSATLGLAIGVPLASTLIRWRAHYTPKGISLDAEAQPRVGPVVSGYFDMFRRVGEVEGWGGLWKGFFPSLLAEFVMGLITYLPTPNITIITPGFTSFLSSILSLLFFNFLTLPLTILINRSIITPLRLPLTTPLANLRRLLTPEERANPLKLYTPLLVQLLLLKSCLAAGNLYVLRPLFRIAPGGEMVWKMLTLALVVVLCPLDVLQVRATVQPLGPSTSPDAFPSSDSDAQEHWSEPVVVLRPDPYPPSVQESLRAVHDEEGKGALARGWWFSLFAVAGQAFSPY